MKVYKKYEDQNSEYVNMYGMILRCEISSPPPLPPPNRQYPKNTPHSCIAATEKLDRNRKMAHI